MNKKIFLMLVFLAITLVASFLGYFVGRNRAIPADADMAQDVCDAKYPLLAHDVDCVRAQDEKERVSTLENNIDRYIKTNLEKSESIGISVFYRDLTSRRWFEIKQSDIYYPASLIKLPVAIVYYKIAELEPGIFSTTLTLPESAQSANVGQRIEVHDELQISKKYSVKELIMHLLMNSDNRPLNTLLGYLNPELFRKVLDDFHIPYPVHPEEQGEWGVSVYMYANMFRSLYNASYLDVDSSQEILDILSKSSFTEGLVKGVPSGVNVAHKFGEATQGDQFGNKISQLHDCGIIYKAEHPYILCIMTRGPDFNELKKYIADISKIVYEY